MPIQHVDFLVAVKAPDRHVHCKVFGHVDIIWNVNFQITIVLVDFKVFAVRVSWITCACVPNNLVQHFIHINILACEHLVLTQVPPRVAFILEPGYWSGKVVPVIPLPDFNLPAL